MTAETQLPHEVPGYEFPAWKTAVSAERQATYLGAAGIDPGLFGDFVDPHILGNDCLFGARPREALGRERLHMGVRLRQFDRVRLGEELELHGRVVKLKRIRKGEIIQIDFSFLRPDGSAPITIEHNSLMLDPVPAEGSSTPSATEAPDLTGYEELRRYQLTPQGVWDYAEPFRHFEVHHDEASAQRLGFRTGIAQGLHMFGYVVAELARPALPRQLDIESRFIKSVYWDEQVTVLGRRAAGGELDELRVLNQDGAVVTTALVNEVVR